MWSAPFVIILFIIKLTHVNTQDDESSFNTTTSKIHAEEDIFDLSTSSTPTEEYSIDNLTNETLVDDASFINSTSKTLEDVESFNNSIYERHIEKEYFDTSTNKTLIDEDFSYALTTITLAEEDSIDASVSTTPVEDDSFDENAFDAWVSKILVEQNLFDSSTIETPVEQGFFDVMISKSLVDKDFIYSPTRKTPVEEESFNLSTSKTLIEEDFYVSTSETPVDENSFYTSTSEPTVEEDSMYASTSETPEEEVFDTFINETPVDEDYIKTTTSRVRIDNEAKMSTYILKVLEHYKQSDPQGFPGAAMPDPLLIPDSSQFIAFGTNLDFKDVTLHGVNKFHIVNVTADIGKMECRAAFEMEKLQVRGKYSLNIWLNSYPGGFISDISGLRSEVLTTLGVEQDGKLRAQNISIDITFKNITIKFENAGFLASMLQGLFNSMGSILYDSIKTYLLEDAHANMRDDINKKLDQIVGDIEFPNTISPMDMVLVDVRKKIKDMKMDPLCIDDYFSNIGMFTIAVINTRLEGLSTFYRAGNVTIKLINNTAVYDINIGTKELQGLTNWEVSGMNGLMNNTGSFSFSVAHIQARFVIAPAMDTRKRMEFRDLHLDVGNIQIRSDGMGTLDYIIELSANILPTLLRYQIIAAIENPIKFKIQEELDRINIEEAITNELPKIDKLQENGFQLAELRMLNSTDEINFDDDDDFFNF